MNIRKNFGADPSPPLFAAPLFWGQDATRAFLDAAAARFPDSRWGTRQVCLLRYALRVCIVPWSGPG